MEREMTIKLIRSKGRAGVEFKKESGTYVVHSLDLLTGKVTGIICITPMHQVADFAVDTYNDLY